MYKTVSDLILIMIIILAFEKTMLLLNIVMTLLHINLMEPAIVLRRQITIFRNISERLIIIVRSIKVLIKSF